MKEYNFLLKFSLPDLEVDPAGFIDALYQAGCDDALVGTGQPGRLALDFTREALSAKDAIYSAIADVKQAIPEATLIEATPDLVGLTDIADILGCSRQNIRNLMIRREKFPLPIHEGSSSLWHLSSVLPWFKQRGSYPIEDTLIEVSNVTMQVNIVKQARNLDPSLTNQISAMLA